MEMRDGSPSIVRRSCPQLQVACRVVMGRLPCCRYWRSVGWTSNWKAASCHMGQTRRISFDVLNPILIASCGAKRLPTYQCNLQPSLNGRQYDCRTGAWPHGPGFLFLLADEVIE